MCVRTASAARAVPDVFAGLLLRPAPDGARAQGARRRDRGRAAAGHQAPLPVRGGADGAAVRRVVQRPLGRCQLSEAAARGSVVRGTTEQVETDAPTAAAAAATKTATATRPAGRGPTRHTQSPPVQPVVHQGLASDG